MKSKIITAIVALVIVALMGLGYYSSAQHRAAGHASELDPKETIFEHLGDAYGWEVPFNHNARIPLPIIVWGQDGLHCFMSSRITGGETYEGYKISTSEQYHGKVVQVLPDGGEYRPWDFSITKNVAALIINTGWSSYRSKMIENLMHCGFSEIISIETDSENYSIEDFSRKFPFVKIIIPQENATCGDLINIGISEASSEYVLVLRDSIDFSTDILTPTLAAKLTENGTFCICPRLLGKENFSFPMLFSPSIKRAALNVM